MKKIYFTFMTICALVVLLSVSVFAASSNTIETADILQLNKTAEVTFSPVYDEYTEDYDWYNFDYYYMFTPDETGTYEFEVTSSNPYKEYYFIDEKGSVCADDYYPVFAKKLEAGNNYYIKITDGVEDDSVWYKITARKHSHSYSVESLDKADFEYNGWINKECKTCGDTTSSSIPYVKSATVSATSFTRTGKQITPGVTVKDSTGKTLKNGVDYLLSGSLSAIDVGTYSLTVKLTGNYAGSKNLSYKILPKGTTVASLTAIGNGFSVRINEQNVQTTGYQIQYSESSNFSYAKIITAKDFSNLTRKVTDLKADVKYYVRVRTYKNAGGKYYYSSWSAVKAVKTLYNASIKLNYSACKLAESQKFSLKATAVPSNLNITWKSSDPSVLKVDSNGKISGIKKGTATVTASIVYNKKVYSANCKVTVKSPAVVLNKNTLSIKNGYYSFLKATTFPSKQTVNWNSSNTSVATVSTAGKVIGKKVGSCVITASFKYGGKNFKASCKVTIKKYTPTKGEQQALRMAKSYVENYDYSEAGLIESLKYEGFTKKEAAYGATNCGANWKNQALKRAKGLLNSVFLSKSGLSKWLKEEGFTNEEIVYAVSKVKVDWNEQALKEAKEELSSFAYSKNGLTEHLESVEGFTHAEAVYAVSNCGVNWNEQALKEAKEELSSFAYSKNGLTEHLESVEGFTHAEAVYAVSNCGVNWNEQALKEAKEELSSSEYSKNSLMEHLESVEGFTHAEAVYAVSNCGADWKEQALIYAKESLRSGPYSSKAGLTEELESDGFTNDEINYAVSNCGANWNEQAVKAAKFHLSSSAYSKNGIIELLESEGFTHSEAVYAASKLY